MVRQSQGHRGKGRRTDTAQWEDKDNQMVTLQFRDKRGKKKKVKK